MSKWKRKRGFEMISISRKKELLRAQISQHHLEIAGLSRASVTALKDLEEVLVLEKPMPPPYGSNLPSGMPSDGQTREPYMTSIKNPCSEIFLGGKGRMCN